jgi:Beta/Gamma crystallin
VACPGCSLTLGPRRHHVSPLCKRERRFVISKIIVIAAALLLVVGQVYSPGATAGEPGRSSGEIPQIIAFDNENFLGDHTHLFGNMKDLGKWGNSISSLIILSGTWEFFDDEDFKGTNMGTLGPGMYANVTDKGIKNNSISSVRLAGPAGGSTR